MTARRIAGVLCAALALTAVSGPTPGGEGAGAAARALTGVVSGADEDRGAQATGGADANRDVRAAGGADANREARADSGTETGWRDLLTRAVGSARQRSFHGETVWVTRTATGTRSSVLEIRGDAGRLHVGSAERLTWRLGDLGSEVVHHEQGWFSPLPAADGDELEDTLDALARKYRVERARDERVLDRRSNRLDIHRRGDGRLAERLWLDATTGLLLRRETFDASGGRLRLATYRTLDLSPAARSRREAPPETGTPLERRAHQAKPVGDRRLTALDKAGYVVPDTLPGDYERVGVYASVSGGGAPLQAVYRDGLYTVSVFQQRGRPDWSTLPEGFAPAADVDWPAYEWPGAVPHRLIWEASGTTFLVIGDAPPDDLSALAGAFPRPAAQRPLDRLRRGLSRIWSAMSPWE